VQAVNWPPDPSPAEQVDDPSGTFQQTPTEPGAEVPAPADDQPRTGRLARVARWPYLAATAATAAFAAVCLGFLLNTPTLFGPDETYHVDRVIAAEHGQIFLAPESINVSTGGRGIEHNYVSTYLLKGQPTEADVKPIPMSERPSLNALGGNSRSPDVGVSNYQTQHPPLYYALVGGMMRLWPGADAMAADKFVLLMRAFNVLLVLPLPFLFFATARRLLGYNPIAQAAAFLPLLVPGIARTATTVNNDNLAIVIGAVIVLLTVRILTGDRSLRTAVLVSAFCVAGSLTKGTIMFAIPIVPVAYAVQYWRTRSGPSRPALAVLALGAVGSAAWWVHNYVAYGKVQPDAWGVQYARAQGPLRGDIPINYRLFEHTVRTLLPSRYWGALGLLEPPQLPHLMIEVLSISLVVFALASLVILRGRRLTMFLLIAVPTATLLMVILQTFLHYRHYLSIPGLQGRYVYPTTFGVLLPFAIVAVVLLGRWSRWAPLVVFGVGLVVSGWALYTSAGYIWLHHGEHLGPSNWARAFSTLGNFFALGGAAADSLAVIGAVLIVAAVALAVAACWTNRERYGWRELRRIEPEPVPAVAEVSSTSVDETVPDTAPASGGRRAPAHRWSPDRDAVP
jgi:hypothetical protein